MDVQVDRERVAFVRFQKPVPCLQVPLDDGPFRDQPFAFRGRGDRHEALAFRLDLEIHRGDVVGKGDVRIVGRDRRRVGQHPRRFGWRRGALAKRQEAHEGREELDKGFFYVIKHLINYFSCFEGSKSVFPRRRNGF